MTEREEIDMLRRAVADLTERVRALEARAVMPHTTSYPTPGITPEPYAPMGPLKGPIYGPAGDPPGAATPMPQRFPATCVAGMDGTGMSHWLAQSRSEV